MLGLSFLSPLFLVGALTAAIPVIIHLLHRRRLRPLPFSTLRFLRLSQEHVARRKKVRDLILLMLRCAFLALLACAFAGPVLSGRAASPNASVHAVFVLDDSLSMGYAHEGRASFDRARDAAVAILDALPRESEAALFLTGLDTEREIPALTPNVLQLKRNIRSAQPGASAASIVPALARAAKTISESVWPTRELYVFTDFQRNAWLNTGAAELPPLDGVDVTLIDCGARSPENSAVTKLSAQRRSGPSGTEWSFTADVQNFGPRPRSIEVVLEAGAETPEPRARQPLELSARGIASCTFQDRFPDASPVTGFVEAVPDSLPLDDRRYFAFAAGSETSVLLTGSRTGGSGVDDVLYLQAALEVPASPWETFVVPATDLASVALEGYAVVVAGQMRDLSAPVADALRDFVRNGGGLLLFVGPDVSPENYNQRLGAQDGSESLLPARLGSIVTAPGDERFSIASADEAHPVFAAFTGPMAKELGYVRTQSYISLTDARADMRVLATYSDGQPAMVEGPYGNGRVLLCTTSCDGRWSNFPLRASFLPVVHAAAAYLAHQEETPADRVLVGQPIPFLFPGVTEPVSITVTMPDGTRRTVESAYDGVRNQAAFDETRQPGVYHIETNAARQTATPPVAVNVDPAESDLTRVASNIAEDFFPKARVTVTSEVEGVGAETLQRREGSKLWGPLLALLVALGLLDSVLASLFTPRRGDEGVRARSVDMGRTRAAAPPEKAEP